MPHIFKESRPTTAFTCCAGQLISCPGKHILPGIYSLQINSAARHNLKSQPGLSNPTVMALGVGFLRVHVCFLQKHYVLALSPETFSAPWFTRQQSHRSLTQLVLLSSVPDKAQIRPPLIHHGFDGNKPCVSRLGSLSDCISVWFAKPLKLPQVEQLKGKF